MRDNNFGSFGGRVLRAIKVGNGKKIRDAILTPEETSAWPLKNRVALHNASKVDFFPDPDSVNADKAKAKEAKAKEAKAKEAKAKEAKAKEAKADKAKPDKAKPKAKAKPKPKAKAEKEDILS